MTGTVTPDYFAVPDPLDPARITYWYRPKRGRDAGRLQPWPPRRARYWSLLYRDMPDGRANTAANDAYAAAHRAKVREAHTQIATTIEADPVAAAAGFAAAHSICCCCGKGLTDERSKAYGIGPECRSGIRPETLTALIDRMREAHAAGRVSFAQNSRDDPQLFETA